MICTTEDWAASHNYEPYALDNPTLTPALIKQVDEGAKNCAKVTSGSETAQWIDFEVNSMPAGDVVLSIGSLTSTDTDASTCQMAIFNSSNQNVISSGVYPLLSRGTNIVWSGTITDTAAKIRVYSSDTAAHGLGDTVTVSNLMVCAKADWAVSRKFVSYTMINAELMTALASKEQVDIVSSDIIESDADNYGAGIVCGYSSSFAGSTPAWIVVHTYVLNAEASRKMQIVDMYDVNTSTTSTKTRFYNGTWSAWMSDTQVLEASSTVTTGTTIGDTGLSIVIPAGSGYWDVRGCLEFTGSQPIEIQLRCTIGTGTSQYLIARATYDNDNNLNFMFLSATGLLRARSDKDLHIKVFAKSYSVAGNTVSVIARRIRKQT